MGPEAGVILQIGWQTIVIILCAKFIWEKLDAILKELRHG